MNDEDYQFDFLIELAQYKNDLAADILEIVDLDDDVDFRLNILCGFSKFDPIYLEKAIDLAKTVPLDRESLYTLLRFSEFLPDSINDIFEIVRLIEDGNDQLKALVLITKANSTFLLDSLDTIISLVSKYGDSLHSILFPVRLDEVFDLMDQTSFWSCFSDVSENELVVLSENISLISDQYVLSKFYLILAKQYVTYVEKAAAAAKNVEDISKRANLLNEIIKVDPKYSTDLVDAIEQQLKDSILELDEQSSYFLGYQSKQGFELAQTEILIKLSKFDLITLYISEVEQIIAKFEYRSLAAQALSSYLSRLPLTSLPYPDWCAHLRLLAHRKRADLMGDLATLYPAILHLGGEAAGRGMVDVMREVCGQWK